LGREQAREAGRNIAEHQLCFDAVFCSPLIRAKETAEIISEISESPHPIVHELLIERDFGVMTGKPVSEISTLCAPDIIETDTITYFLAPTGAETFPDLLKRANLLLEELRIRYENETVLLVTHGDMGKMIYASYYKIPWQEVLTQFHFGNSELLKLVENSPASDAHVFKLEQHNH
jgi:probable phosphoglycerate mutase